MTSPIDISCSEPTLLPEKDFMIKSATMTPTAQSHKDFLLNTTVVSKESISKDTLSPNCTCTNRHSDECKKCAPSTNSTRPIARDSSPMSPLLPPARSAPEGLTVNRNMSTGYGSTSRSPSPMEDDPLLVEVSPTSVNTHQGDVVEASIHSIRCACHVRVKDNTSRKARIKLVAACVIALVFMTGEVVGMFLKLNAFELILLLSPLSISHPSRFLPLSTLSLSLFSLSVGGYFSHSLAIMTDAAHMLSDFASFLISLFSIWMATRPPSKRMSFGWHRAGNYVKWYMYIFTCGAILNKSDTKHYNNMNRW